MPHFTKKRYGHEVGLSCAFRQWKAKSHCSKIHGYPLAFTFIFSCEVLDARDWVLDFGGLKPLKAKLEDLYDHRLIVAEDDPHRITFQDLHYRMVANVRFVPRTGCESFAQEAFEACEDILKKFFPVDYDTRYLRVVSVECAEHGGNSALYMQNKELP